MPSGRASQHLSWVKRPALVCSVVLVASLGLAASPGEAGPGDRGHGAARPTIAEVRATLDTLAREAEMASENLNAARVRVGDAKQRLRARQAAVVRQRTSVTSLRRQAIGLTLSDYENAAGLSTATSFLVADDPGAFMRRLVDDAVAQQRQADVLVRLTHEQDRLATREKQAEAAVEAVQADRLRISDHKAALAAKTRQAQDLLDSLQARQRARLLAIQRRQQREAKLAAEQQSAEVASPSSPRPSRSGGRTSTQSVPTSSRAQIAVDTALAQIGDPYVYGAAGPDAFDCSGLTMYAWAAAGVSIPHASSMQPSAGTPVAVSDLMPGDLVFYYSPISHVGMYIGNGQIVHAPHTGSYVQIVPLDSMPIAMAVRIG